MASISGFDGAELTGLDEYATDNSTLLSLHPWVYRKERFQVAGPEAVWKSASYDSNNLHSKFFPRNATTSYCSFGRPTSPLRSRKPLSYSVKHLNSAEICLLPQLHTDDFEIEEFVFSPVAHQNPKINRAFRVTDGSQIISKSTSSQDDLLREVSVDANGNMIHFAALPKSTKTTCKNEQSQRGDLFVPNSRRFHKSIPLQGSLDDLLCFCLGITVGIASTMTRNKREIDKLNDLLKSKENLVQDLQEELEMKDSISVKELLNEACENEVAGDNWADIQEPNASLQSRTSCRSHQGKNILCQPTFDNPEVRPGFLSDIEAEMEAELARLELSFSASNIERKMPVISNPLDILISEKVSGELREDMTGSAFKREVSDRDSEGTSTRNAHPVNYSVSPKDLSIRLHEVIKSRLEERIKELEAALYHNQKQLHAMESEMVRSVNLNSDIGSSSGCGSPNTAAEYEGSVTNLARPLCLNLAGDALDAYGEAYDEFMRMAETEDLSNGSRMTIGDNLFAIEGKLTCNLADFRVNVSCQDISCENKPAYDRSSDWFETDEEDDDDGRILIEQIVNRVQKESDVILNAQQILSKDEL